MLEPSQPSQYLPNPMDFLLVDQENKKIHVSIVLQGVVTIQYSSNSRVDDTIGNELGFVSHVLLICHLY